ncbi:IFT140 [Cordylochernes scorpioides]|uniref:IFT140 n=1 Tax=Cordylochernes scorpioides TaxID=51811 RepID=A0ABY6K1Y3_9ARAC|nr:IFT140 [Cordylochernes scorpioides]
MILFHGPVEMSVFVDYQLPTEGEVTLKTHVSWHTRHPLLAVASFDQDNGGQLSVYQEVEGSVAPIATGLTGSGSHQIMAVSWNPVHKLLVLSWESAELSYWTESKKDILDIPSSHKQAVNLMCWNSTGTRFLSIDVEGTCIGWRLDGADQLSSIYHHELKDSLTDIVFRRERSRGNEDDDETEFDMIEDTMAGEESLYNPSARWKDMSHGANDFYLSSTSGVIFYVNENGSCGDVAQTDGSIKKLLHNAELDLLIAVTESLSLVMFHIQDDGTLEPHSKFKLSGRTSDINVIWAGPLTLALSCGESLVRMWHVGSGHNFVLSLDDYHLLQTAEIITSLAYESSKKLLVVSTTHGQILAWKKAATHKSNLPEEETWKPQLLTQLHGAVKTITTNRRVLAIMTTTDIFLLREQEQCFHLKDEVALVQISAQSLYVESLGKEAFFMLNAEAQVKKAVTAGSNAIAILSDKKVLVYEISSGFDSAKLVGSFESVARELQLHEHSLYLLSSDKIEVKTFQGTLKQSLTFTEEEGRPMCLDICGSFLTCGTEGGWIKMWNLSRREARPHSLPKHILGKNNNLFLNLSRPTARATSTSESQKGSQGDSHIYGKIPFSHHWDPDDPKLLICEAGFPFLNEDASTANFTNLLAARCPHPQFYLWSHTAGLGLAPISRAKSVSIFGEMILQEQPKPKARVIKQPMKEFEGLSECDKSTREAIMNFSFYLTCGNMDEAFKSIRVIKNEAIWKNLAQMCVKTRRLDVAMVCLGKMGNARGARALRLAADTEDLPSKVALLALNLGMVSEAEELYRASNRFDLLNKLYQDMGQWDKAIEVAQKNDRIHLRNTYYNYGQCLEAKEEIWDAISMYEKSGTHHFESKNKSLYKWWAQYLESVSEMEAAIHYYELAQDYLSWSGVYCYCNNLEKASEIANESGDRAACFHLGRNFENLERMQEAIHFFTRAQAYSNAMRICKECELEDQLQNLALLGSPREMVDAAQYYQDKPGYQDRAVLLYHKAGYINKALDLAFQLKDHASLQVIANELGDQTDPELLKKCSHFFLEHGQYEKAVDLLALSKNYEEALNICMQHYVPITEELAQKLTVDKEDAADPEFRIRILEKIGECCLLQENYQLAAKKFTQAGNRVQAMKALLKSGDVEKIVFFANVSRQKELYIMAANYLQSADWRKDQELLKHIVNFYTKGKAFDMLAGFYDTCAQIEIDEYQNYEKALKAVTEAARTYAKCDDPSLADTKERVQMKIKQLTEFVQIQRLYSTNRDEAIQHCQHLLMDPNLDLAVRRGDVYGFMVEHYVKEQNFQQAYSLLQEMQEQIQE